MSINEQPKPVLLDGTTGGTITINPESKGLQFAISGRATGNIAVTVKANGSDVFEEFDPVLLLDLATQRTAKVERFSVSELKFVPSVAGGDFTVTVTQWP